MSSELKEKRLEIGYTIEEVSEKLNIRKRYLIELEEENYSAIPGQIYVDGYTKLYAEFLGIESGKNSKLPVTYKTKNKKKLKRKKSFRKYVALASAAMLGLTFFLYNYVNENYNESKIEVNKSIVTDGENENYQEPDIGNNLAN